MSTIFVPALHLPPAVLVLRDWLLDLRDNEGRPVLLPQSWGINDPTAIVWYGMLLDAPPALTNQASAEVQWPEHGPVTFNVSGAPEPGQSDLLWERTGGGTTALWRHRTTRRTP